MSREFTKRGVNYKVTTDDRGVNCEATLPAMTMTFVVVSKSEPSTSKPAEPERFIRLDTVIMLTKLSRATLWRMEREGRFPKRVKIGLRAVAWRESDIREWLDRR